MGDTISLRNHFLIAMPTLQDPNFFRSVTYICDHDEQGAFGIVINQPLGISVNEVVDQMGLSRAPGINLAEPALRGGPVDNERGFVLHEPAGDWLSSLVIDDRLALTASSDILDALIRGHGPARYLLALGYAGWGAGQLERELSDNSWLSGPADTEIMFATEPDQRWARAAALLGVDIHSISGDVGHA